MTEMDLPFLPFALPEIGEDEIAEVVDALRSGWVTTGPKTRRFEADFAAFLGDEALQCVAVNSATAGLHLALEALGIGPGDEVITTTHTFTATAEVVRYLGADVKLVDIDPATLNIDPAAVEAAITPRTKAVLPVHYAGLAADMPRLLAIARRHGLKIVEDAAHALPTTSGGELVGTLTSEATVFSFYANKTMTTGEGGMLVTRDAALAGLPLQLPPRPPPGDRHAWHLYVLRLADDAAIARDRFIERLFEAGIGCSVHYIPLHLHPYWRDRYALQPGMFPHSQHAYERMVSLPLYTRMDEADVARVAAAVRLALRG
jgi:dTDP-4-amino-4,6-dideoxygalactose transaminase